MVFITLNDLISSAKQEESDYHLKEAIRLFKQILAISRKNQDIIKVAELCKKIGDLHFFGIFMADTEQEHGEMIDYGIEIYEEAIQLYNKLNIEVKVLECLAGQYKIKADKGISQKYCLDMYANSLENIMEVSEIYRKQNDKTNQLHVLEKATDILAALLQYCINSDDFEKYSNIGDDLIDQGWALIQELGRKESIGSFLFLEHLIFFGIKFWIHYTRKSGRIEEIPKKHMKRQNEGFKALDTITDKFAKAKIYLSYGNLNCTLVARYIHDEEEQQELLEKGINSYEKALEITSDLNIKPYLINIIFWLNYHTVLLGKFQYVQKRIVEDIKEVKSIGKIYQNLYTFWGFLTNFLSAFYYQYFSQRSFLNIKSRITYAKNGIKELEVGLEKLPFGPFFPLSYQLLTTLYSQLILLTNDKDIREKYIKEMFACATKAEETGKIYKGGMSKAAAYTSLYRAYKTMSDVTTNKREKISNLMAAIEATKKNIDYAVEYYLIDIATQMHLGILYEDLAILSKKTGPLHQARELFLQIIKITEEKGYYYPAAAAHEYLARIEDRLGNFLASAKEYELASKAHSESLKKIKFKLLKDRVREKLEYNKAWNLIESAKLKHKNEDHLKAKGYYEKACEILNNLTSFQYEATYYSAWARLEASEEASKMENHNDAILKFKETIDSFSNAIDALKKVMKKSSNNIEKDRKFKLQKVANVRISYCTARINLEKARILQKQGENLSAAENFALAASQFRDICTLFKIEREKKELEAIYHLCRAWESMAFAENYQEPDRFSEASKLFLKASKLFSDSKLKLLASGNSSVCLALEYGCKFNESTNFLKKTEYYKEVKTMLRKASNLYEKGGFNDGADWALATLILFDGLWNLIKADDELELESRKKILQIGIKYLKSAAEIFGKSGYIERTKEINEKLKRIEKERGILHSALNIISNPVISRSTAGIVAPACPIESSLSPKLSEINQLRIQSKKRPETTLDQKKYEIFYDDFLAKSSKIQKTECRIGIAQIGLSKTGDILTEFYQEKSSGLLGFKNDKISLVKKKIESIINNAAKQKIDLLVFP
ncbi:MAG: hypothetical protein EU535_07880, partial [Promethearchaeota archaeon]